MKKSMVFFLAAIFIFSSLALAASAQQAPNFWEAIFQPFGSRLEQVYDRFGPFIDAVIYLIIFLGLTQATLGRIFESRGRGGKTVIIGIGIVLALSLALWEREAGFNIKSFGPVAALILISLMGYAVWTAIKSLEIEGVDTFTTTAIAYLLVYNSMAAIVPNIIEWINKHMPIVGAILALLTAVFTIAILIKIIRWIISLFSGAPSGGGTPSTPTPPTTPTTPTPTTPPSTPGGPTPPPPAGPNKNEVDDIQGFLIRAAEALKDLHDKKIPKFEAAVKKWGDEWIKHHKESEAVDNARYALEILKDEMEGPFRDDVIHNLNSAHRMAAVAARSHNFASVKPDLETLRDQIEAVIKHASITQVARCTEYYKKILEGYIRGGRARKLRPSVLQHAIMTGRRGLHLVDDLKKQYLVTAHNEIAALINNVRKILGKI